MWGLACLCDMHHVCALLADAGQQNRFCCWGRHATCWLLMSAGAETVTLKMAKHSKQPHMLQPAGEGRCFPGSCI